MSDLTLTVAIDDNAPVTITGRDAWALRELMRAGNRGCTPIDNPAPRWSAYVFKLRRKFGVDIETIHEGHGGSYPGTHARYILRSPVSTFGHEGPSE